MKCKKCRATMLKRNGKYGPFMACPNSNPSDNHGTVSVGKPSSTRRVCIGKSPSDVDLYRSVELYMAAEFGYSMSSTDKFLDIDNHDGCHWTALQP